ncbi:S10 family peptidase [Chelativorans sp. M5D2P16]|uniref:S10 family peptidase n=1 Tax=Chelativorans sp. M5D2P16 TaxID=3095678 RepID=UPI002ACAC95B|nr:peptidase S10 [Chelativorans sp. M5D2P16]MDZ5695698.1 peptidase S10 [Chelativorans sp. M5D2P16]
MPETRRTRHTIRIGGEDIRFMATAGAITLTNAQDRPEADIAFVSYTLEGADPAARPVTLAVNGGPGAASAYLHLGVLGPWILPMDEEQIVPSQKVGLVENPQTWLAFTDLVFIDPVGTGFSRLVDSNDRLRERYLSIDGDIEALARFIVRWLTENGRLASPKFFVGESYGGFRGPLLAEALQTDHGVGLSGMVLLSPVLDFGWWAQPEHSPLPLASRLPSFAATEMERRGTFSEEGLREAEAYASGAFVTDFLRGVSDEDALGRIVERVSEFTGLPQDLLREHGGRIGMDTFTRNFLREEGRIASSYDAAVSLEAPVRGRRTHVPDPVLDAMTAPLTSAMLAHYRDTLGWLPERRYHLLNTGVNRAWEWGGGRSQPEAISALGRVLSLDPAFRTLVVHGYTDLVTPYFASQLLLRQLPAFGQGERLQLETYRGGHMFYTREGSRSAFRDDARSLYPGR